MKNWTPNEEEAKFLDTILSMSVDCKMGMGTVDRETYISNLRTMCNMLEKIVK